MSATHVILTSAGTDGDILPCLRLGRALVRRGGCRVTLVVAEPWRERAGQAGLEFAPLVTAEENAELFSHPDFWNPWKTAPLSARWGVRFLERQYRLLAGMADPRDTVLVASPAVFAASLVHERHGVPLVSLALQPWVFPSAEAPPVMPVAPFPRGTPAVVWRWLYQAVDLMGDALVGPALNRLRGRLGLPPVQGILGNWWSRQLVLGLFPAWYGAPQPDWPAAVRLTGFPLPSPGGAGGIPEAGGAAGNGDQNGDHPGEGGAFLPEGLRAFCQAGTPPVAFTWGTGMARPGRFFEAAAEACRLTGRRAVFLTKYPEALPPGCASLSEDRFITTHAPFDRLFPLCRAVVHHGGIGTVASVLAAGVPQLVCPLSFDQPDNAARLADLGVAEVLPLRRLEGSGMAAALDSLLQRPDIPEACGQMRRRLESVDGLLWAAQAILDFASTHLSGPLRPLRTVSLNPLPVRSPDSLSAP